MEKRLPSVERGDWVFVDDAEAPCECPLTRRPSSLVQRRP
jgi:hypothetical protein